MPIPSTSLGDDMLCSIQTIMRMCIPTVTRRSISFDSSELVKIPGVFFYEERLLFMLLLLRHPSLEVCVCACVCASVCVCVCVCVCDVCVILPVVCFRRTDANV